MAHFLEFTNNPFKKTLLSKRKKKSVLLSSDFALDIRMPGVTPKQVRGIVYLIICVFYIQSN